LVSFSGVAPSEASGRASRNTLSCFVIGEVRYHCCWPEAGKWSNKRKTRQWLKKRNMDTYLSYSG
jgi:hypothetical protein